LPPSSALVVFCLAVDVEATRVPPQDQHCHVGPDPRPAFAEQYDDVDDFMSLMRDALLTLFLGLPLHRRRVRVLELEPLRRAAGILALLLRNLL
jgi:hypothetical protein